MDIVSSSCKPRIVCRWPFAVASVDAAAANAVVANANFIVNVYVTGRLVDDNGDDDDDVYVTLGMKRCREFGFFLWSCAIYIKARTNENYRGSESTKM